jgi:phage gp36-like protein
MKYANVSDMIELYGSEELQQLTDRGTANVALPDSSLIQNAIEDAEAEVDAYLVNRYALPLAVIPDNLKRLTCDIARYQLYGAALTEEVEKRYKSAITFLKNVASGIAALGAGSSGSAPKSDNPVVRFGSGRTFSADSLRDYSD